MLYPDIPTKPNIEIVETQPCLNHIYFIEDFQLSDKALIFLVRETIQIPEGI